jgi:hypothetical protein
MTARAGLLWAPRSAARAENDEAIAEVARRSQQHRQEAACGRDQRAKSPRQGRGLLLQDNQPFGLVIASALVIAGVPMPGAAWDQFEPWPAQNVAR